MKQHFHRIWYISIVIVSGLILSVRASELKAWDYQRARIEGLFEAMDRTHLVFIRNGTVHDSQQAVAHLRMKLDRAQNSWFAPNKEQWTAEMFIDKLASRSSFSGQHYLIRFVDGQQVEAGIWLYQQLAIYDDHNKSN
ncbi:DUF5329 family protein [Agarivorans sp. QJM3NY_29]|uniref:DUF5329 family protein n=1 Tax=unclassified Agarivorans TaxID=2636026 RepID=UPI003D7DD370